MNRTYTSGHSPLSELLFWFYWSCFKTFTSQAFSEKGRIPTNLVSGLGKLYHTKSRLLLLAEKLDFFPQVFARTNPPVMIHRALMSYHEILLAEEERINPTTSKKRKSSGNAFQKSSSKQVEGDQDADATIPGDVLRMHLHEILHLTMHRIREIRQAAITLLTLTLKQGLINPLQSWPCLIASSADVDVDVRRDAHREAIRMDEKYPDQLHTKLVEGVLRSYRLQTLIGPQGTDLSTKVIIQNPRGRGKDCVVGKLYTSCIQQRNRRRRNAFLNSLIGLFGWTNNQRLISSGSETASSKRKNRPKKTDEVIVMPDKLGEESSVLRLKQLRYVASILAALPYNTEQEPLLIIYTINRMVTLHGTNVLQQVRLPFSIFFL
jgi:hypothetical protein